MLSCLENNKRPLLPLCSHICPIQHSLKCAKESLCVFAVVSTNVFADVSVSAAGFEALQICNCEDEINP